MPPVELLQPPGERTNRVIININSEATSRRLPVSKAISIINTVRKTITGEILLVGSPKEKPFVDTVYNALDNKTSVENAAGQTSLPGLLELFATSTVVLTTDSGPAHVSNALQTHTIVLFGAGNEKNTAPYNQHYRTIIRLGKLSCEPCVNNTCKRFGVPECLLQLDEQLIAGAIVQHLKTTQNVIG
jgi:ADP-heptose:LPS heptosyltransferase